MKIGDRVWTYRAKGSLIRPGWMDARSGVITGIIPKPAMGHGQERFEVTFDSPSKNGNTYDFYAQDLEVIR